jgi:hypothetical protein
VWIQAVARAWAGAWAAGIQCDDKCFGHIDVVAESVGSVLVDAVTDAYAFVCGGAFLTHLHSVLFPVFSALNACYYDLLARDLFGWILHSIGVLLAHIFTEKATFHIDAA